MSLRMRIFAVALLIGAASLTGAEESAKEKRPPIYQTDGKGMARVKEALALAQKENRRVLLMVGGNWCGWCHKLHDVFTKEPAIRALIGAEYDLVTIDSQADRAVIEKWKIEPKGYPYLVVLDATGAKLTEQETGSLEIGSRHDPKKVQAFLERWKAAPLAAGEVFAAALKQAREQQKNVFLRVGTPWCRWCVRMDRFLAQPSVAKLLAQDYVVVKIDSQRMTGARAVIDEVRRPGEGGGIPWFAFLDSEGRILVTSTRPGTGNVGFPVDRKTEIPHFVDMLKQTRSKISDADIAKVVEALIAAGPQPRAEVQEQP